MSDFTPNAAGFRAIENSPELAAYVLDAATGVRDRARRNAAAISSRLSSAIETSGPQRDADGAFVDVGYDPHAEGFVLWWHEVGTVDFPATPHLRPAMRGE